MEQRDRTRGILVQQVNRWQQQEWGVQMSLRGERLSRQTLVTGMALSRVGRVLSLGNLAS